MRIGVRAHDLGKASAEILAQRVAERGLSCVQLTLHEAIEGMDRAPGRLSSGLAYSVGGSFRKRDIQIAVLSCYINPIHPDEAERVRQVDLFKEYVRYARDFGCGLVATETGSVNTDFSFNPKNHTEESFQLMLKSIGAMVGEAERFGVLVGVEGVAQFVASDPRRIGRMLDEIGSNNLQIVFDPVNLLSPQNHGQCDQIVRESFALFGDRIAAVHAKDFVVEDGRIKSVPLGKGRMNYPLLLGLLQARKPLMNIIIEDTDPRTIDGSIAHLRSVSPAR
jgi:sugar phosphate isomerase/epimerase